MRCVWNFLIVFAILPIFAIGCGPATMTDNVSQEELDADAAEAEDGEAAEEAEAAIGDEDGDDSDDDESGDE